MEPKIWNWQDNTIKIIDFMIQKAQFFDRFSSKLNERQIKVASRVFEEGHEGFKGGLSAENYMSIVKTSGFYITHIQLDFSITDLHLTFMQRNDLSTCIDEFHVISFTVDYGNDQILLSRNRIRS